MKTKTPTKLIKSILTSKLILLITIILAILFIQLSQIAQAYILEVEPKPEYCDDCIVPQKVEIMSTQETYQTFVILSMLTVNLLKTFGMFWMMKRKEPETTFNPAYLVSALLGVFMGYAAFIPQMTYEGTYINIFMQSGFYAIGANLMFDFAGKVKEKNT